MGPDNDYGGFQTIGLGQMLSDAIFRANIPEDVRFHLKVRLQDPRGINLRNEVAHGLATRELPDRGVGNWDVHLVIMAGVLRLQPNSDCAR